MTKQVLLQVAFCAEALTASKRAGELLLRLVSAHVDAQVRLLAEDLLTAGERALVRLRAQMYMKM